MYGSVMQFLCQEIKKERREKREEKGCHIWDTSYVLEIFSIKIDTYI